MADYLEFRSMLKSARNWQLSAAADQTDACEQLAGRTRDCVREQRQGRAYAKTAEWSIFRGVAESSSENTGC